MNVCELLEERGVTCWIAPRDVPPGAKWDEAIVEAIQSSHTFLLILSAAANDSPYVSNEVNHAFGARKTIFTFRMRLEERAPADVHVCVVGLEAQERAVQGGQPSCAGCKPPATKQSARWPSRKPGNTTARR